MTEQMNGKQLRAWREKCGVTQVAIARYTGVSDAYIKHIESGLRKGREDVWRGYVEFLRAYEDFKEAVERGEANESELFKVERKIVMK